MPGSRRLLFGLTLLAAGCGLLLPPETPSPVVLGCFEFESDIPASFADTLGYELPPAFQLSFMSTGQWLFLPTDEDWAPTWSHHGKMPSDAPVRRARMRSGENDQEMLFHTPGDSVDITFPGPIGGVVVRLGPNEHGLGGRAAYTLPADRETNLLLGTQVTARRTSCESVPRELRRTRYRDRLDP